MKNLEKAREYLISLTIIVFPLFFATTFIDQVQIPKLIILGFMLALILIVTAIQFYLSGKVLYARGKFDLPVIVIVLAYTVSALTTFNKVNKIEAFFSPGNASFIIGFGILYFLLNTIDKNKVKTALIVSAFALSITIFASFLGIFGKSIPQNLAGDYITSSIFLVISLPFALFSIVKEKKILQKLLFALALVFILVAAGISIYTLFSNKSTMMVLPDFNTSWSIAVDAIKESPLFGSGAGNYLTAFNKFRPLVYNSTNLWQIRFSTANDWYLTLFAETGILGLAGIAILVFGILNLISKSIAIYKESRTILIDLVSLVTLSILLIVLLFFPATPVTLMLLFVLIALNSHPKVHTFSMEGQNFSTFRLIASILVVALILFFGFKVKPVILAEAKFKEANDALNANDGKKTYTDLQTAINLDPYVDRYHASYAQVNLAIARSILAGKKDPKDLSDSDKNTLTSLIQQTIREGQNTVALNPDRSTNWEVLAKIYQSIIPLAAQADSFAAQSFNQAIALDQINPLLRVELGQLYYSLGQYDNAISAFQFAVLAKPDLANAHYNLAIAYRDNNQTDKAITELQTTLTLVKKDSADYKLAQSALDDLQKKKTAATPVAQTSTNLTTPEKATTPVNPAIKLPSDASPPASVATPAP